MWKDLEEVIPKQSLKRWVVVSQMSKAGISSRRNSMSKGTEVSNMLCAYAGKDTRAHEFEAETVKRCY